MRLRDKCVTEPIKQSTMQGFLNMWDRNMMQPTAHEVSQVDLERFFFEALEHCQYSEVQHELRFYKEGPMRQQTQSDLRRRIDRVLRTKEIAESRKTHERSLNDALSLGPAPKQPRGHAGKKGDGQPKTEPKTAKDAKSSSNAVDGGNTDLHAKLSHKDRQIQALAAQIQEHGGAPIFVNNLKGSSKGKKGRSRSPGSAKDSDAGSV